jgi:hypothetical protein
LRLWFSGGVTTLQKAMPRPTLFSNQKLEMRVASLAIRLFLPERRVRQQQASAPNYSPTERKSK